MCHSTTQVTSSSKNFDRYYECPLLITLLYEVDSTFNLYNIKLNLTIKSALGVFIRINQTNVFTMY